MRRHTQRPDLRQPFFPENPMHNVVPKMLALILVAGGFAATGDLAWLTGLGLRLANARTVPSEEPPAATAVAPAPPAPPTAPSPPAFVHQQPSPQTAAFSAPLPPASGPDVLALDTLSPGDRLVVWLGSSPAAANRTWVAFDLIDPVRLEAIAQSSFGSPRRVRLRVVGGRGSAATLAKGLSLLATPIGIAHDTPQGAQGGETIGPVAAFAVTQAD